MLYQYNTQNFGYLSLSVQFALSLALSRLVYASSSYRFNQSFAWLLFVCALTARDQAARAVDLERVVVVVCRRRRRRSD